MTPQRQALLERIALCEKEGRFDEHTLPPDLSLALPVDENFCYLRRGIRHFFPNLLAHLVYAFVELDVVRFLFDLKVEGKENLHGVDRSVIVSNHIHMFDCVAIRHLYHNKEVYSLAAEFNNRGDFLGFMMRYSGMLPLSSDRKATRHLSEAISTILAQKHGHLLVFPEGSEWLYYDKPRPFKPGAFHFAAEHDVPVQPMFFTFADENRVDAHGDPKPRATLHIGKAIYEPQGMTKKEVRAYLAKESMDFMRETYARAYQKPCPVLTQRETP